MNNATVATTILEQLGGHRFLAMTGARNLTSGPDRLYFGLPRNPGKVTHVGIVLEPSDTYTLTFWRMTFRGSSAPLILREEKDIYAEDLQARFTESTGLYTRL
jgi:hypothetical protein